MANPKNFFSAIMGMFFLILISTKIIAAEEIRCCNVDVIAIVIIVDVVVIVVAIVALSSESRYHWIVVLGTTAVS